MTRTTHMTRLAPCHPVLHEVRGPWARGKHDFLGSARWLSGLVGNHITIYTVCIYINIYTYIYIYIHDQFWFLGT